MTTRRDALAGLLGTGVAAALPLKGLVAATAKPARMIVVPAKLERSPAGDRPPPFIPRQLNPNPADYAQEEWFVSGRDDAGRPYKTLVLVRFPRDRARFSGTLIVESMHAFNAVPIYGTVRPYLHRSGHGWVCIVSQKTSLDGHVKPVDKAYYSTLGIGAGPVGTIDISKPPPAPSGPLLEAYLAEIEHQNEASHAIVAQVAAAIRRGGPFAGWNVKSLIYGGNSQTSVLTTNYIRKTHESHRRAGGLPIFDGYFTGAPDVPHDVPIMNVTGESDVSITKWADGRDKPKTGIADSDAPMSRVRLLELPGMTHGPTRDMKNIDPSLSKLILGDTPLPPGAAINTLPQAELKYVAMHQLVRWTRGVTPPHAQRIQLTPDKRDFARDAHGNSLGGVRCVQLDVPRATYVAEPKKPDGTPTGGTAGYEFAFSPEKMRKLYGTKANYVRRYNARLDQLIRQGWFLAEDADGMRAEAEQQSF